MRRPPFRIRTLARVSLAALALGLSMVGRASAQAPASADPAAPVPAVSTDRPRMDLSTTAPPPPQVRSYQQHEGFYTRVDIGVGALLSGQSGGPIEASTGGLTGAYDVLIGAGPAPGITLGGAAIGSFQLSGDWTLNDNEDITLGSGDILTLVVGPFIDAFPDSKGGFHVGGSAGLGFATFDVSGTDDGASGLGAGGAFWTGWDVWIAPEWSMGGLLRIDALYAKDDDVSVSSVGLSLMFSVLYN